jgi:hypothetical protein
MVVELLALKFLLKIVCSILRFWSTSHVLISTVASGEAYHVARYASKKVGLLLSWFYER